MSDSVLFFSPIFFRAPDLPLCIDRHVPWCGAPWAAGSTSWDGRCLGFEVQTRLEPGALEEGCWSSAGSLSLYMIFWGLGSLVMVYFSLSFHYFFSFQTLSAFSIFPFNNISFSKYPEAGLLILVSFWLDIYFSFLLAWICLLLLLPCNNNKIICCNNNELTSLVDVVSIYLYSYIFYNSCIAWLYNIINRAIAVV